MSLFEQGQFQLHSGDTSFWRINCNDLTDADLHTLGDLIRNKVGLFNHVTWVVPLFQML